MVAVAVGVEAEDVAMLVRVHDGTKNMEWSRLAEIALVHLEDTGYKPDLESQSLYLG